jgi:hypothetical protein
MAEFRRVGGRGACVALALLCLLGPGSAASETVEEEPAPESEDDIQGWIKRHVDDVLGRGEEEEEEDDTSILADVRRRLRTLPPFREGSRLRLTLRSYYMYGKLKSNERREAWVYGGSAFYESDWLADRVALGGELFTSLPIHAPGDRDGTALLRPRQRSYTVLGQSYAKVRIGERHIASLYRQTYDLPYLNRQYNRMTPNTFEGYTLAGEFGEEGGEHHLAYTAGYVTRIKQRNSDRFLPMGEVAAPDEDPKRGTALGGALYSSSDGYSLGVMNLYTRDVLNILYVTADHKLALTDEIALRGVLQFTDQRSVGDDLITGSSFDTQTAAAQLSGSWRGLRIRLAGSTTASEAKIRTPWGLSPTPLWSMLGTGFQRADEDAWLVGVSMNLRSLGIDGLSASMHFVRGSGARDETSGDSLPDQRELDMTFDYRPQGGFLRGWWFRVRGAFLSEEEGGGASQNELRIILNYDLPIL